LFFKKNATSREILSLLDEKKIEHMSILKTEFSEQTGITKLSIKSLKIINQIFPLVEVTFVNDKIAELEFSTKSDIDEDYFSFCHSENSQNKIDSLNKIINEDNPIYEELFEALKDKYGIPPNSEYFKFGYPFVDIPEFDMSDFITYKYGRIKRNLVWESNKDVQIILCRQYLYNGVFKGETQTKVEVVYDSFFKVQFEKKLIDNANNIYDKTIESINQRKTELEKKKRLKELERI
jgi:hypothetical protein